ncbi:unnamed protein product [Rangifer tarandus platyrhynchus]|uniref:Uncharacterized protein n=2 Tax=Rangifer tarandus platyrhynchus TaxID=3082113 RepID=A0ABN8ZCP5_RANTA|nr:unnamed protein product [Rangifer tarandus platyrhynchus]
MKVKSESEAAQSCPTLSDPMDRSLPGSSIHGVFQARVLEWDAIAFSVRQYSPEKKNVWTLFISQRHKKQILFFLCIRVRIDKNKILYLNNPETSLYTAR